MQISSWISTLLFIALFGLTFSGKSQSINIGMSNIDTSTIATNLHVGWEIIYGPDNWLWLTERNGYVIKVQPATGEKKSILKINDVYEVSESGLLGMVLHPDFIDSPYVYLVYNYLSGSGIKERLVRYTYSNDALISPITLLDNIEGGNNHNGSRLIITPDKKLLMTTGDATNSSLAQNLSRVEGKVLRMNLDGSVPADNPISGSLLFTWGHRNPQGLVISDNGRIYISEHGPNNDDEINILRKDRNYGWPIVEGYCDSPTENNYCNSMDITEPIKAWTPTIAVAGIDYYNHSSIPEWDNAIIMVTLKESDFRVLKLNNIGDSIVSETIYFDNWFGRLRDICVSPEGEIFLTTSNLDGRGTPKPGDDKIVRIANINVIGGIKKLAEGMLVANIYPARFKNQFYIEMNHGESSVFKLYDVLGNEVKQVKMEAGSEKVIMVNRGALPSGIYYYVIKNSKNRVKTGKLVAE